MFDCIYLFSLFTNVSCEAILKIIYLKGHNILFVPLSPNQVRCAMSGPGRLPSSYPMNFRLWGYPKDKVYCLKPKTKQK